MCSLCNEGAQNITAMRPDLKQLLVSVRRATADDQLNVLEWLIKKFPVQARVLVSPEKP